MTRTEYAPLLEHHPHISKLILVDTTKGKEGLSELRESLRSTEFDHIFDLHNNFRTKFLRKGIRGKLNVYKKSHWKWMALVALKLNFYKDIIPVPERYMLSTGMDDLPPVTSSPELFLPPDALHHVSAIIPNKTKCIAICPGAKHATKRYPRHHWEKVIQGIIDQTPYHIIILGGKEDSDIGEALETIAKDRITNFCGSLSLVESAAALKRSLLAISNDSGLMHIATAVQTPVVSLFGSTVREFGFFPYNADAAILEVEGLACRPCTHIGRKSCPKRHFKCMENITPEYVIQAVSEIHPTR